MHYQRVAITGCGVVAPNGVGSGSFWSALLDGKSGIGHISRFDTTGFRSKIAGEVTDFNLLDHFRAKTKTSRIARHTQFALAAANEALCSAGIELHSKLLTNSSIPVAIGVSSSAMDIIEAGQARLDLKGPGRVPSYSIDASVPHQVASLVANELGLSAQTHVVSSACAAGMEAVALAYSRIQQGQADIAIAGGTDASINALPFSCIDRAGLSSRRNGEPELASRPFDRDADSGVISEGCAIVVLESIESAEARGATPFCEITGCGTHADRGQELLSGLSDSVQMALANAARGIHNVDLVCAHGPGHPDVDLREVEVLKEVFGDSIFRIPITSIKGSIGNPLAAAGPLQIVSVAHMIRTGTIPAIMNLDNPAPGCDLDFVRDRPRQHDVTCALVNIHGLGGGNGSMILEAVR